MITGTHDSLTAPEVYSHLQYSDFSFWERIRWQRSLALFQRASTCVPAYMDFLRTQGFDAQSVSSGRDYKNIPMINKENYLRAYPLEELCWDGTLKKPLVFTSTSGSTGKPFYFPRHEKLDWEYSLIVESFLKNQINAGKSSTLVIIGFGMGVWIGGLITYQAFQLAAQRLGYPVSIITPGVNKDQIFSVFRDLSPNFENTILIGYPPFIKDVIDEAPDHNIHLDKLGLRLFFAAESFTDGFRQYLGQRSSVRSRYLDTLNVYGSADIGAMAWETPVSIFVREFLDERPELFQDIFGSIIKTPTLAQFNPFFINFESINGELILTGNNAIPLIRYSIGDQGGVFTYEKLAKKFLDHGFNLGREIDNVGISKSTVFQIPFVYVYERSDFSISFYGIQIYPEYVKEVLIQDDFNPYFTSKFSMLTKYDEKQDQYFEINVELKPHQIADDQLKDRFSDAIVKNLCRRSSEYTELSRFIRGRAVPEIVFWPYEHETYFKKGIKQRWVYKSS